MLISAVSRQAGGKARLKAIAKKVNLFGADLAFRYADYVGFNGFSSHSETSSFYLLNRTAILEMLDILAQKSGQDTPSMVASFPYLKGAFSVDEVRLALSDQPLSIVYKPIYTALSLLALQWVCGELES
jgi:hypothetical protein